MARRRPRTRAAELTEHIRLGEAMAQTCSALVALEPDVPDFMFARKVILDGVKVLEEQLKAETGEKPSAEAKA